MLHSLCVASPRLFGPHPCPPFLPSHPQVNERYPKEVEKRQKRLTALSEALASGISTESDLQRLSTQATTLHNQITEIQDRKVAQVGGDRAVFLVCLQRCNSMLEHAQLF